MVATYHIAKILVNKRSLAEVIYLDCFRQLNLPLEVRPVHTCLVGFFGETLQALGEVTMPISLGCHPARMTKGIDFLILDCPTSYNMILGRPYINMFQAVIFTYHIKMKFPVGDLVGEV